MALSLPVALCVLLLTYLIVKTPSATRVHVPTVTISRYLPHFISRLLYCVKGASLIKAGYKKYKDQPFRILKIDTDVIVLPAKYLAEIRHLNHNKISLVEAQYESVCGDYIKILNHSHLPALTVSKKLTPAMSRLVPKVMDELQFAWEKEVPKCSDGWVPVNIYSTILKLINRATSRVIVGDTMCRSEQWLNIVTDYTHHLGITVLLLRPLPKFLRAIVAFLLPSTWYLDRSMKWVKYEVFVPIIQQRREAEATDPDYKKPDDFMQWMMDLADNDYDKDPANIAQGLMIVMALAVVHTSTMLITHGLYDLLIRPEYLGPLRHEIIGTLQHGWANATQSSFALQRRLDSFLRESQRFNPTGDLNVQRIAKETLIFSDGFIVPKGTHICFAAGPISLDPAVVANPDRFDGFRWCKDPDVRSHSLVSISESNLHFGYGRAACPGRFFAANTAKAILSRLLVEYDIKFEEGKEGNRPWNIRNGEQLMPNIWTKVLIKRRGVTL